MITTNYHTHSHYCGHGNGNLEDYIISALQHQFTHLGFSEHGPFPGDPFGMRMNFNTLADYTAEINELHQKYHSKICLNAGLEIEYLKAYDSYYPLLFSTYDIEYLIMGQHFFIGPDKKCYNLYDDSLPSSYLITHVNNMLDGMKTGYFQYIAHPDLMFIKDYHMDKNCIEAISLMVEECEKYQYTLELNANGFRRGLSQYSDSTRYPYPVDILWKEVGKTNIPVIIGSDCHDPSILCDSYTDFAFDYASKMNLNLITHLHI